MAFENLKPVRLAADADTPAELLPHVGTIVMVPAGQQIPATSGSSLAGLPGYGRTNGDVQEWVMAGAQDELLRAVNRFPPEGSWRDLDARRVWRRGFDDLRSMGAPAAELKTLGSALYAAAAANIAAAATPPA